MEDMKNSALCAEPGAVKIIVNKGMCAEKRHRNEVTCKLSPVEKTN